MGGRFLFPGRPRARRWLYAARTATIPVGGSVAFSTPAGERVTIARRTETGGVDDFVALSSVCPHLGCQVHWQAHDQRFFCPCHNGIFDPGGRALSGPPADAGQSLSRYPLRMEGELLMIEVPVEALARTRGASGRV
jgi:cytochrome b6-f complex iron-sulfur subunit